MLLIAVPTRTPKFAQESLSVGDILHPQFCHPGPHYNNKNNHNNDNNKHDNNNNHNQYYAIKHQQLFVLF